MAIIEHPNPEHLKMLRHGAESWNRWRAKNPDIQPDLRGLDAHVALLIQVNFSNTNLLRARITNSELPYADFSGAFLKEVTFRETALAKSSFKSAVLTWTDFSHANLRGADFSNASVGWTTFGDNDLSEAIGLDTVHHIGPSILGIDTLYRSKGKIPEIFLRGCGVPDELITYSSSLLRAGEVIQFYSCFISYSTKDEEFARRLYSRMRDEHLRVWFAPEDVKGGEKLYEQIERAIQIHDRLLLILSEHSMQSEWVMTEIRKARKTEIEENRRKLFPITIVDFDEIKAWKCFDADSGKDLAIEVREYFIPDFSNWKDHDAFEAAFDRLLRDLKAS